MASICRTRVRLGESVVINYRLGGSREFDIDRASSRTPLKVIAKFLVCVRLKPLSVKNQPARCCANETSNSRINENCK